MLAVLTIAIIPLCRLSKYRERVLLLRGNKLPGVYSLIGLHFLLPVFLLMAVPVFLKIPLWVIQAFVPDVFLTIIVSAVLLLAVGFLKRGILWAHKKTIRTRKVSGGGH